MAEAIRLTSAGIIVPKQDAVSMSKAMLRLAADGLECSSLGRNALAGFEAHFTLGAAVSAYGELYAASR
jgi:hypothetical protein